MIKGIPERVLIERRDTLVKIIAEKKAALKNAPEGTIHIKTNRNYIQYYHRTLKDERNGRYLNKSDQNLTRKLLQKKYDEDILRSAEAELKMLNKFLLAYDPEYFKNCYLNMDVRARSLVKPIELPDDEFVNKWLSREYDHLSFRDNDPVYLTKSGLRVRSKSELLIADMLTANGIPFLYECPLVLPNGRTVYPDFTILNVRTRSIIIWEHFGMMDDCEYSDKALLKIREYKHMGYYPGVNLLLSFESGGVPLSIRDSEAELLSMLNRF